MVRQEGRALDRRGMYMDRYMDMYMHGYVCVGVGVGVYVYVCVCVCVYGYGYGYVDVYVCALDRRGRQLLRGPGPAAAALQQPPEAAGPLQEAPGK